jgi:drug/metabolite transporter (DMT)-like permease
MKSRAGILYADLLLLLTAAIWGFAFVAQRVGMEDIGPFAFNAVRYAIGVLILLPLIRYRKGKAPGARPSAAGAATTPGGFWGRSIPFVLTGGAMFIGASLQQLGIVTTTAGNAAFVTSLYVVIIPLLASLCGRKTSFKDYAAALISVLGLYIITVGFGSGFSIASGDLLVLAGSLFWAIHILVIGKFASTVDPVELSAGQFAVCGFLSFIAALLFEPEPFAGTFRALVPLLYGGVFSCGVAFTLQIVAQRRAPPAHASILLATEGLFGAIGGVLLLSEPATLRLFAGGALMLGAAILSQLPVGKAEGAPTS